MEYVGSVQGVDDSDRARTYYVVRLQRSPAPKRIQRSLLMASITPARSGSSAATPAVAGPSTARATPASALRTPGAHRGGDSRKRAATNGVRFADAAPDNVIAAGPGELCSENDCANVGNSNRAFDDGTFLDLFSDVERDSTRNSSDDSDYGQSGAAGRKKRARQSGAMTAKQQRRRVSVSGGDFTGGRGLTAVEVRKDMPVMCYYNDQFGWLKAVVKEFDAVTGEYAVRYEGEDTMYGGVPLENLRQL